MVISPDQLYAVLRTHARAQLEDIDDIAEIQHALGGYARKVPVVAKLLPHIDPNARFYELLCTYALRETLSSAAGDTLTMDLVVPDTKMQSTLAHLTHKGSWDGAILINGHTLLPVEYKSTMINPHHDAFDARTSVLHLLQKERATTAPQSIFAIFALPYTKNPGTSVPLDLVKICSWLESYAWSSVMYVLQLLEFDDHDNPVIRTIVLPHFAEQLQRSIDNAVVTKF